MLKFLYATNEYDRDILLACGFRLLSCSGADDDMLFCFAHDGSRVPEDYGVTDYFISDKLLF
jgi:hypothetical protein